MKEIVCVNLENEMDLILAHKRSMKLAELCGLSHIVQTTFATAVSEIARMVIGRDRRSKLELGLISIPGNKKELMAVLYYEGQQGPDFINAVKYARRLVNDVKLSKQKNGTGIILTQGLNFSGLINDSRVDGFINYFKNELPLSPYDELRKKNIQLIEMAEKLKESESQYRSLSETLPLMMFTTNGAGYVNYANKWMTDFFGLPDLSNGKTSWLSFVNLLDSKLVRAEWHTAVESGSVFRQQARLNGKRADELPVWHLISVVPNKSEQGHLQGWIGFFVDIHAQKLVEETLKDNKDLKQAQKQLLLSQVKLEEKISELNKSNHDLEQFAYIASHDLQEPLRKIRSFGELLEKSMDDPEKRQKYMSKIDESSSRMSKLIKDVLDYSRLRKSNAVFDQVNLEEVLSAVKLDMELMIEEKKAKIISDKLPVISGIKQQLYQLFYNLVSNSLKFSETNPEIRISCRELSTEEVKQRPGLHASIPHVEISLADNGIGFDPKYATQVFTIFKRLNTKNNYSGTGIGLALCKKIVDNHHGEISASSEPGKGAEFKMALPVE